MKKIEFEFIGEGSFNLAYLSDRPLTALAERRGVLKNPKSSARVSDPKRAVARWRLLNPGQPEAQLFHQGWIAPYVGTVPAADRPRAVKLIELYLRTGHILLDGYIRDNVKYYEGELVFVDMDYSLRPGSPLSESYLQDPGLMWEIQQQLSQELSTFPLSCFAIQTLLQSLREPGEPSWNKLIIAMQHLLFAHELHHPGLGLAPGILDFALEMLQQNEEEQAIALSMVLYYAKQSPLTNQALNRSSALQQYLELMRIDLNCWDWLAELKSSLCKLSEPESLPVELQEQAFDRISQYPFLLILALNSAGDNFIQRLLKNRREDWLLRLSSSKYWRHLRTAHHYVESSSLLHQSAKYQMPALCELLIKQGAIIDQRNALGQRPQDLWLPSTETAELNPFDKLRRQLVEWLTEPESSTAESAIWALLQKNHSLIFWPLDRQQRNLLTLSHDLGFKDRFKYMVSILPKKALFWQVQPSKNLLLYMLEQGYAYPYADLFKVDEDKTNLLLAAWQGNAAICQDYLVNRTPFRSKSGPDIEAIWLKFHPEKANPFNRYSRVRKLYKLKEQLLKIVAEQPKSRPGFFARFNTKNTKWIELRELLSNAEFTVRLGSYITAEKLLSDLLMRWQEHYQTEIKSVAEMASLRQLWALFPEPLRPGDFAAPKAAFKA